MRSNAWSHGLTLGKIIHLILYRKIYGSIFRWVLKKSPNMYVSNGHGRLLFDREWNSRSIISLSGISWHGLLDSIEIWTWYTWLDQILGQYLVNAWPMLGQCLTNAWSMLGHCLAWSHILAILEWIHFHSC